MRACYENHFRSHYLFCHVNWNILLQTIHWCYVLWLSRSVLWLPWAWEVTTATKNSSSPWIQGVKWRIRAPYLHRQPAGSAASSQTLVWLEASWSRRHTNNQFQVWEQILNIIQSQISSWGMNQVSSLLCNSSHFRNRCSKRKLKQDACPKYPISPVDMW